jgi:hypothetical protein
MNKSALLELASRCEASTGPDRKLDFDIASLVRTPDRHRPGMFIEDGRSVAGHPDYTASLDAAMGLVPVDADAAGEQFKVECWNEQTVHPPHVKASAWVAGAKRTYAATPALALTAAALRALAEKGE